MNYNLNSGYGQLLGAQIAASVGPVFGRILVVAGASDVAVKKNMITEMFVPDPDGKIRFYATYKAAYDAAITNADDVILLSGHSTHVLASGLAWTKSRIHTIGMDGGHRLIQQGAKVSSTDTAADAYVLKVTGTRNTFENLKIIQNDTNAAALHVVEMGGEGTLWKNVSFIFGVVDNLDQTNAYEVVNGEDSGTFINCMFGSGVLKTTAARAVMVLDQVTTSQESKDNIYKDCVWNINSSDANAHFIRVLANTDMKFMHLFIDPIFFATITNSMGTAVLTEAVENEVQAIEGNMLFIRPSTNTTQFSTATNANTNIKVVAAVSAANVIEGIAPIA